MLKLTLISNSNISLKSLIHVVGLELSYKQRYFILHLVSLLVILIFFHVAPPYRFHQCLCILFLYPLLVSFTYHLFVTTSLVSWIDYSVVSLVWPIVGSIFALLPTIPTMWRIIFMPWSWGGTSRHALILGRDLTSCLDFGGDLTSCLDFGEGHTSRWSRRSFLVLPQPCEKVEGIVCSIVKKSEVVM